MPRRDLVNTIIVSFLIAVFLMPVAKATGLWTKFPPAVWFSLLGILPIISLLGMTVAYFLGKKLAILWQLAKFALVGVLNTAIDFGTLNFLIAATNITSGPSIIPIKALAFSTAVLNSYFWNRRWVFEGAKSGNFALFFAVTALGIAVNALVVFVITTYIPPIIVKDRVLWANAANILATVISMVWNFLGYRLVVFKK